MSKITTAAGSVLMGTSALNSLMGNLLNTDETKPYSSTLSVNGKDIASTNVNGNNITANYNMSDDEKNLLDYTNQNLLSGLKNINVFSNDIQKNIQNQVDAYKAKGVKTINDIYNPMISELKNDIASRFGNLDNSAFMDNLNSIEKNRADALSSLTQDILAKQNELYEQEMTNRYNYLNTLSSTNEQIYSNILNFLKLANTTASK